MRVAVCDDDLGCGEQIEQWVKKLQENTRRTFYIRVYTNAETFLKEWRESEDFDLIFLDIELPGISGVELGAEIRKHVESDEISIVFISGKDSYCMDLFGVEPLNFHLKPLEAEDIVNDVEKVWKRKNRQKKVLTYREEGFQWTIPVEEIVYVEAKTKLLEITLRNEKKIVIRDTITRIAEELKEQYICQCHRSYLVNMRYVNRYLNRVLFLENGREMPVGKTYVNEVKRVWERYEMEEL